MSEQPTREHDEAQIMPGEYGDLAGTVLEIGFHAEHKDESANQLVADRLGAKTTLWRQKLGKPAELDTFDRRRAHPHHPRSWEGSDPPSFETLPASLRELRAPASNSVSEPSERQDPPSFAAGVESASEQLRQ